MIAVPTHWACEYMGLPWSPTGMGPRDFNCYGLVQHVQREVFGRPMPRIDVSADAASREWATAFRNAAVYAGDAWAETDRPRDGAIVLMGTRTADKHIGVFAGTDGGVVVHCERGAGVASTAPSSVLYPRVRFLKYVGR